eukprot:CAMPEP_0170866950 /NCGR_PEP_ID=MMETSP0734-20130129/22427_1 /TAXON_ID=186038 /ORGANISM="Fragilariopsis kerguelensis, Strain L26-C5" /LENGTH=47 /DNA_ID= /DNA_START= /DNA_END= /DNA_ORIENTATION=
MILKEIMRGLNFNDSGEDGDTIVSVVVGIPVAVAVDVDVDVDVDDVV